jgi:type I restriction enzyme S subunit
MSVDIGEILISKVRPNLKKYVFINEANHSVYFTKAFIKIKPKIMPAVLYYCLRTVFNRKLVAASRQGKGYPTVGQMDLEQLRFEKHIIDKLITHEKEITEKIKLIDEKTKELQDGIVSAEEIIDSVFQNEFNIDKDALIRIDNAQLSFISLASISEKNINCRLSYRWNKANQIQNELSKQLNCCQPLGPHILNTQNGWSPSCSDDSNMDYQVLGIDAINKSGILSFENPKYSSEYKNDLEKYTISNGDFFVSRGNTTSLVALASIAYTNAETPPTIFPDLMIKITFGTAVNQTYMAYVFNSFIGRLYFKYATKGKNQTMVKVSSRELSDFIVPIPDILTQEQIACHIQREIEKQNDLQEQILNLRNQIHQIIIATIQKC